ncbi:MAG: sigma-70 family RNA polymerase sigma factor [Chitinophagaceae bacterium]|uniref:RNA polymerase sigma factor n=1 Tax=unclassified Paraflavitalea TaxID=2798305 RepID=UPI003D359A54|nr:sigma-70 family RNA polymerase sigma factor [Chitinophagaceae bacterium]
MEEKELHSDLELVGRIQSGDKSAFNELYYKYHLSLYKNALKFTKNTVVSEDIVQETFVTLWQKKDHLVIDQPVSGWLFVICYNKSINWLKKQALEQRSKTELSSLLKEEHDTQSQYEYHLSLLNKAMDQLSPQKRAVFERCKLQGKTYKETAAELQISPHTVKEYLTGAMNAIRAFIHQHPETAFYIVFFGGIL